MSANDEARNADGPASAAASLDGAQVSLALGASDIVGVWDGDLVAGVVYGDANFARIYGVDPDAARKGVPRGGYLKNIHPDDILYVRAEIEKLFAGAPDYMNEHRIIRPDGGLRWVLTRGRVVRDTAGVPTRFAGVSVDITARKRAEVEQAFLLALSDRLRSLDDPGAMLAAAVTALGQHLGANRVGYAKVEDDERFLLLETCYTDGVPPISGRFPHAYFGARNLALQRRGVTIVQHDLDTDPQREAGTFAASAIRSYVSVPLMRDGRFRAALFASFREPHAWDTTEVALVESVAARVRDAIERARAEDSLRRLNLSLETEIEARIHERERTWKLAPVLMVVGGQDGVLREVNPAWSRVLGWSAQESVGHDIMDFVAAGTERLATGTAIVDYQTSCLTKGGESRCISWTTVIEAGCFYGYGRDVTEQVLAEDQLRQAQKMEAVGQLTGGVAHDFNNLLAGIGGCLELLDARIAEGRVQESQPFIAAARGAARRAAALTHRLLAFSRRQTLDPRPTDVNALVGEIEELIRRTVGPGLQFSVVLEPRPCITWADAHQLENALLNLCINARDAMPDGGDLTVRVGLQELESGDFVTLEVADTGSGMSPEVLRRAFDPFFTTKPIGAGTGLGLSMVYGFARQSGGEVRIQSQPGAGTRVVLYLPRHAAAPVEVVVPPRTPPPRVRPGETVLVVDDEPTVRLLVVSVLQDLGYQALEAEDGATALETLRDNPHVALLVTDVGLPGHFNGRQLAVACREVQPRLRVLFVTGYTEDALLAKGSLPAGMSVLTKPFAVDVLEAKIAELMEALRESS